MIDLAAKIIKREEESNIFKSRPYYCSNGYPSIGWGFRIPGTGQHDPLPDVEMNMHEGNRMLDERIKVSIKTLENNLDTAKAFKNANDARKAIMLSMVHQVGIYGFLKFKRFIAAASSGNYDKAADEMIYSSAYKDSPNRWKRQAQVMRTGSIDGVYS